MNPSDKTIRLTNKTQTNLSLQLMQMRAPASPGIRRAALLTPINISVGGFYDVCAQLGVNYMDAQRIVGQSPEVKAFEMGGRLGIVDYPPAEAPAPAPTPVVKAAPAPLKAVPPPPPAPMPVVEPVLAPVSMPEMREVAPEPEAPSLRVVEDAAGAASMMQEPSMDWSEDKLRDYAKTAGIDISKAKSKTAVLRTIRSRG